jgi:hypothetical protein
MTTQAKETLMTKPRIILSTVGALAVLLASACAPAVPASPAAALDASATPAPTEAAVQTVATSRGPNLEATDPTTVRLASGQLQLVEFFRFT